MNVEVTIKGGERAMKTLAAAGGPKLTAALRAGYAGAARVIRDKAKQTTAFTDDTGKARRSWRISSRSRPFNHAKVTSVPFYTRFLELKPLNLGYFAEAAETTEAEQLSAVRKALARHIRKLRSAPK